MSVALTHLLTLDLKSGKITKRYPAFDWIRLLAALMVIIGHSLSTTGDFKLDPVWQLTKGQVPVSYLAVDIFFVLSGFLILESWRKTKDAGKFIRARVRRLAPGFIVAYALCVFVFGPLGAFDLPKYFQSVIHANWIGVFTLDVIPDLSTFTGQYYGKLNGSLWTIQREVGMYAMVLLGGLFLPIEKKWFLGAALIAGLSVVLFGGGFGVGNPLRFATAFLIGMNWNLWGIEGKKLLGLALIGLWFVAAKFGLSLELGPLLIGSGVLLVGTCNIRTLPADISYGVYLYAWPVMMVLFTLGINAPLTLCLWATVCTLPFAYASYRYVEKPFLAKGAKLGESPALA